MQGGKLKFIDDDEAYDSYGKVIAADLFCTCWFIDKRKYTTKIAFIPQKDSSTRNCILLFQNMANQCMEFDVQHMGEKSVQINPTSHASASISQPTKIRRHMSDGIQYMQNKSWSH